MAKAKTTKKPTTKASTKTKATKKTTTSKTVAAKPKQLAKITKAYTKSELLNAIALQANLDKKPVKLVLEALENIIFAHLKKGSVGKFTLPKLLKMTVKSVAAKPERMGRNPATGENIMLKAKPASKKIKINALRALKEVI